MTLIPHLNDPDFQMYCGDAIDVLRQLPAQHVHCIVCSPPYWGLRDYGIEGQLGLEETPQEYVAKLVEVFSEARRVLRNDGTLWLNLGDSYASNWGSGRKASWISKNSGEDEGRGWGVETALPPNMWRGTTIKPKDLCMVPARVALALQEPHYTGKIRNEADRAWLAAIIDGEGCIYISRSKTGARTGRDYKNRRKQDAFDAAVSVTNTSRAILDRCVEITGIGNVRKSHNNGTQAYTWGIYSSKARELMRELYPHLVAKQDQARLMIACPPSGDDARKAWESLKALHKNQEASIDFPSPKSMYEKGWYLRQDIIWSKPNCMPESVRDRCTTSHEHVFLLTKKPRYYFDQDAIREPYHYDGRKVTTVQGKEGSIQHRNGERWPGIGRSHHAARAATTPHGHDESEPMEIGVGRNKRSVWEVSTKSYPEAHFATFPEELIEPMIKAGCPEGGTVLDCFAGAGTTALVARRLGRKSIGIELSPAYCEIAAKRLAQLSLLA